LLAARFQPAAAPLADGVFTSIDAGLHGPLVRHQLAVLDREEGQLAEAEQHWRALLDDTPAFTPARLGLADLYVRQERWPELEMLLAELEAHAPHEAAVLQARMQLARKDFAAARQRLEDVLRDATHFVKAQVVLSHVLLQAGDETAAEPQLRRLVQLDPAQAESWRNLAVLYRRRHRLREAIATAQAGRLHCPDDADLLLLHGVLLREGGDAVNAETCLLGVLERDTNAAAARQRRLTARQQLVGLYRDLARHREADAHLHALAVEAPDLARRLAAALADARPRVNSERT
jgi:Tfp pilus assembly protein PilF